MCEYQTFAVSRSSRSKMGSPSVSRCVGNFGSGDLTRYCKLHNLVSLGLFCVQSGRCRVGVNRKRQGKLLLWGRSERAERAAKPAPLTERLASRVAPKAMLVMDLG